LKLPRISGKRTVEPLLKADFTVHRTCGSHYILKNQETGRRATVHCHRRELAPETLQSILKQAGISAEEFINLM
jgi:predicted RNA binding protein YcfA (HicA-like mRNA interferase family)